MSAIRRERKAIDLRIRDLPISDWVGLLILRIDRLLYRERNLGLLRLGFLRRRNICMRTSLHPPPIMLPQAEQQAELGDHCSRRVCCLRGGGDGDQRCA